MIKKKKARKRKQVDIKRELNEMDGTKVEKGTNKK